MNRPTTRKTRGASPLGFVLYASAATPLVAAMVYANPSQTPTPQVAFAAAWPYLLAAAILAAAVFASTIAIVERAHYPYSVLGGIALLVADHLLGNSIHRDFHSLYFMHAVAFYLGTIANKPLLARLAPGKRTDRIVFTFSLLLFVCLLAWVLMMGFAISTRAEPRPTESVVYNVYFIGLVIALFYITAGFRVARRRRLTLSPRGAELDGRDLGVLFTDRELRYLAAFARGSSASLRCRDLNLDAAENCASCDSGSKASTCRKYKKTQESIAHLNKILVALDLGAIAGPSNKRHVLDEGWTLEMKKDVDLEEA